MQRSGRTHTYLQKLWFTASCLKISCIVSADKSPIVELHFAAADDLRNFRDPLPISDSVNSDVHIWADSCTVAWSLQPARLARWAFDGFTTTRGCTTTLRPELLLFEFFFGAFFLTARAIAAADPSIWEDLRVFMPGTSAQQRNTQSFVS